MPAVPIAPKPYRITLIGCSATKAPGVARAAARELYCGSTFRLMLRYAEATSDEVFILSARYGVVLPDQEITTYDEKLKPKDADEWFGQLRMNVLKRPLWARTVQLVMLAGDVYAAPFRDHADWPFSWLPIQEPLRGRMIGYRRGWLCQELRKLGLPTKA